MIISAKANGDILNIKPEVFYQGSTEANKIYLIAPLVANSSVSIGFTLPNMTDIPVTLMTLSSAISDTLNTWIYEVPATLTQYVGLVKVNIAVTTPTGTVITVKRCQFEVKRGDEVVLPEEPEEDVYDNIVTALAQVNSDYLTKVDIGYTDGDTAQSIVNNSNGLKFVKTVDGVTVTVEVTENGLEINGIEINSNIDAKVSAHNTSGTAHTDIREDISDILDGTTPVAEASHATRADTTDLTNVTDTINDVPISEIFEEDGKTAKLATADADGNNITETYATKVEILSKADLVEGKVPSSQLPSYVDDVEEVATFGDLPEVGENGKIYVTLNTNLTYRWSGSEYVEISKSLALGETSATAYRGDRGKIAYDHSQVVEGNPHGTKTDDISDEEQLNKFVTNEEKTQIANAVPNTRTVNSKVLSDDIILNSDDISDTDKTNKWTDATEKEKVSKIVINGDGSKALLNDGTYGEVGTVDTVNGVLPDENKNITIDADNISDTSTINKFATAEELAQIDTNAGNIADLQTEKIDKVYSTDYAYTDGLVFTWVTDHYIVGDGTTTAGNGYTGTATTIVIPKYYDDGVHGIALVTGIGQFAFSGKITITSVTIPSSVTSIGDMAFSSCTFLTNITIPSSVTSIGDGAFFNCDSLTNITIPSSVTSIGFSTFQSCNSLINITIPNSVTSINDQAFAECTSLTSITMEATTPATLGADVFIYSGITTTTGAIYVPYASLTAYKTAENWSTFADIIFAIPDGELIQDIIDDVTDLESNKADKVSGATDGNIAELDSSGNLKDSGVDISDFVTISDIVNDLTTGGTDVPLSAEQGKVLNTNKEDIANKNVNNGYCPLDSGGKVPLANLPSSLLKYQGVWNASTNTPTLTNPDLTKIGYVYNVSVAGTQFDIDFSLGDWLIYNASGIPEKSDNSDDVVSVNGQTGAVVLNTSHISATTDKNYVTDAEKTKLGNVLEKTTTGDTRRVYGINSSNEQELTEIEETPTASSAKLVTSGGVKTALDNKATKLSIGQWNVPYRDEAGSGEPNTSRLATMTSPLPSAILIRDADGKATFVGGTSDSQGIVKSQLDSAVENMVTTNTEQTITGVKTFATGATPLITDAPTNNLHAVNKTYADSVGFARVYREATDLTGITYPVTIGALTKAIIDANLVNCMFVIGMNSATETKVTDLPTIGATPQTFGTLTIIIGSSALRMRIEYNKEIGVNNALMWVGSLNRSVTPYTVSWKMLIDDSTDQTISGVKTFNAPTNIALTEQTTAKFMTSNGGSVTIGKEGPNSGTMLRFDQVDGTERLKFRGSATAGAMVWSQPEANAGLYMDLADSEGVTKRITFNALQIKHPVKISSPIIQGTTFTNGTKTYMPPSSNGTLALTSDILTNNIADLRTGTVSQTLTPNEYWNFTGAPTTLTLTLGTAVPGKMNEYMFQFVANASGTTLTAISGVTWVGGTPTITASKTYQASILNGYGIIVQVD